MGHKPLPRTPETAAARPPEALRGVQSDPEGREGETRRLKRKGLIVLTGPAIRRRGKAGPGTAWRGAARLSQARQRRARQGKARRKARTEGLGSMQRAEALKPIDEYLADKWSEVAEGLSDTETRLADIKRKPAA